MQDLTERWYEIVGDAVHASHQYERGFVDVADGCGACDISKLDGINDLLVRCCFLLNTRPLYIDSDGDQTLIIPVALAYGRYMS